MIGQLDTIVLDAANIERLATFYADLTGWRITDRDDEWITIQTDAAPKVAIQLAPDHVAPDWPGQERPQQGHLDLLVDGIEAAAVRAEELGATRLGSGASWITLADPAGHPFDLCQRDGVGPVMGLYGVTLDAPDAAALARFYAELLGLPVTYEGPEGALVSTDDRSVMFQQVGGYRAPRWPDPAHPQQLHLDVDVADLDEAEERVLALGASRLREASKTFRVYADPAGHPFCLCVRA